MTRIEYKAGEIVCDRRGGYLLEIIETDGICFTVREVATGEIYGCIRGFICPVPPGYVAPTPPIEADGDRAAA